MYNDIRSMFLLDGKVALVTGASKGIGEAMAYALACFGASVVVSSRKQDAVDEVADSFKTDGLKAIGVAANPVFGPVQDTDKRAFDKIIDVNLKGPFELCKRAYPIMKQRGGGSIIHISSIGGLTPEAGIGIYSVSKAAIINLTQAMAQDWGADNIRVNAICPGLIKTKFSEALWNDKHSLDRFIKRIPLGRIGEPDDIAGLAVYLASAASAYCTGGVYMVDGGYASN